MADNLAERLRKRGYKAGESEDRLLQVCRGETVVHKYAGDKLVETVVTRRHKDVAMGLMLESAMGLNDFGLAPTTISKEPDKEMYRRFAPTVDSRILAYKDSQPQAEGQATPAEVMTLSMLTED